jgi:hypothetical protein
MNRVTANLLRIGKGRFFSIPRHTRPEGRPTPEKPDFLAELRDDDDTH